MNAGKTARAAAAPSSDASEDARPPLLEPRSRAQRIWILLALILLPQFVLFGPSIVGARVLLPLDILEQGTVYAPFDFQSPPERQVDYVLSDLVFELEPERVYAAESVRSGRIPFWNPLNYCGTPFLAANHSSVFYPLRIIDYLWPGPISIAWVQLVKGLLAGIGAYLFARRVLRVSFWPAAVGAAVWPNVGFLVLWAGFTISQVGAHLPWLLLCADETIRKPKSFWPAALALATAVLLVSGHASIAAHVLLATGLYAIFRIADVHGVAGVFAKRGLAAAGALVLAWAAGFLVSGPQTLPTLDYMRESLRIQKRQEGKIESKAVGLAGLPTIVMPYFDGSSQRHTILTVHGNRPESTPAAYAGMLALLVLAPLGFLKRRLLRFQFFWLALGFLGLTAVLGVPLIEKVFELPGLNTLRNNRFTLVTAWSTVAMMVAGLEVLVRGEVRWTRWSWIPAALLALVIGVCVWRVGHRPEVFDQVEKLITTNTGSGNPPLDTLDGVARVSRWFTRVAIGYALLAGVGLVLWFRLRTRWGATSQAAALLGVLAIAEVTLQGYDANVQAAPELYYPRVPVLQKIASLPPGRMVGMKCLPACLNQSHGLVDVRGYDAADPLRIVELLRCFKHEQAGNGSDYAAVQWWFPHLPHGLARLVGLRYLLAFGPQAPPNAVFTHGGYSLYEMQGWLPRAFFAARGEVANDKAARLAALSKPEFDPRAVVYLESESPLPVDAAPGAGTATFTVDEPERVVLALDVQSPGWLVLSDRWTSDWKARVDGVEQPVLPADHAFRAVHVASGAKTLEFTYEPKSWRHGLLALAAGLALLVAWCAWVWRASRLGAA